MKAVLFSFIYDTSFEEVFWEMPLFGTIRTAGSQRPIKPGTVEGK